MLCGVNTQRHVESEKTPVTTTEQGNSNYSSAVTSITISLTQITTRQRVIKIKVDSFRS